MCDGERNSRLKKSVEATANRTEGQSTKIGGSAPEPTVSPPHSQLAGLLGSIFCYPFLPPLWRTAWAHKVITPPQGPSLAQTLY
jgi:hypothetical protein